MLMMHAIYTTLLFIMSIPCIYNQSFIYLFLLIQCNIYYKNLNENVLQEKNLIQTFFCLFIHKFVTVILNVYKIKLSFSHALKL